MLKKLSQFVFYNNKTTKWSNARNNALVIGFLEGEGGGGRARGPGLMWGNTGAL